jgi:hypothetical protein
LALRSMTIWSIELLCAEEIPLADDHLLRPHSLCNT